MSVVDLFAGAGGWDLAARQLGVDPIGIEVDPAACATRAAAGLRTIQADLLQWTGRPPDRIRADVADLFATDWPEVDLRTMTGLIASPPCPAFSDSGQRLGMGDLVDLVAAADTDTTPERQMSDDARLLALPLSWALELQPAWTAWEQVPPVLPFWEAAARRLGRAGWHTWTGIVNSADHGVPQTRRRAILIAHRNRPVGRPPSSAGRSTRDALGLPAGLTISTGLDWRDGRCQERPCDQPAPTLTGKSVGQWRIVRDLNGGTRDRADTADGQRLTLEQAARLQDFPDGYPFAGTQTEVAQQIGNAIPVRLARAVLEQVIG